MRGCADEWNPSLLEAPSLKDQSLRRGLCSASMKYMSLRAVAHDGEPTVHPSTSSGRWTSAINSSAMTCKSFTSREVRRLGLVSMTHRDPMT